MNTNELLAELVDSVETLLGYIDAIPKETADAFPAMPGCDRDEVGAVLDIAKSRLKKSAAASVIMGTESLQAAVMIKLKHSSLEEFSDWIAGQNAIAYNTGFLGAVYVKSGVSVAYYRYAGNPKEVLPALPVGQSYVWHGEA